ncbi:uncharacterized protein [Argopecten irradians]|uniref:uncharacterized protein n=1 Tax=Argopecten irradians TaxID=31199 RepID=UPI0037219CF5
MSILGLSVLVSLVAVGLGQDDEPAAIRLNRTCEIPVSATVFPITEFRANTTSMVRTTKSVLKLSNNRVRSGEISNFTLPNLGLSANIQVTIQAKFNIEKKQRRAHIVSSCQIATLDKWVVFRLELTNRVFKRSGANKQSIKEGEAATAVDIKTWVSNTEGWVDLCPEKPTHIQPRHWFIFGGRLCLTPLPWRNFKYPTMQCVYRSCQLVRRPLFFCRPDVRRVYTIPIYCFNTSTGKFQKEKFNIYTYRYCTCCRYGCPISDTLTRG